jgi:flagellar secretion chaperone FliS
VNPYAAAKLAYTEASVLTASPERLVVLLYDGAIRYLHQAAASMRAGRHAQSRDRLHRAQAVIEELHRSLDLGQGEIATNLASIYRFCLRHLIEATANSDPAGYEKIAELLTELRESWEEIERRSTARETA